MESETDSLEWDESSLAIPLINRGLAQRGRDAGTALVASCIVAAGVRLGLAAEIPKSIDDATSSLTKQLFTAAFDPFTTIGGIATVVVAVAFSDQRIDWPLNSTAIRSFAGRSRLINAISVKRGLLVVSFFMCVCCWTLLFPDLSSIKSDPLAIIKVLTEASLLALSANFVATRRDEIQLAFALVRTNAERDLYLATLARFPERPSTKKYYYGFVPALVIFAMFQLMIWMSPGTSIDTVFISLIALAVFGYFVLGPTIGIYYAIRALARIRTFKVGRIRFFLALLYSLLSVAPISLFILIDSDTDSPDDWSGLTLIAGLVFIVLLPVAVGWKQVAQLAVYEFSLAQRDRADALRRQAVIGH